MLSDTELAKVQAQRHKMAEVMEREGISLFAPPCSAALQEFRNRIGSGGDFTAEELAFIEESAALAVQAQIEAAKK